MSYYTYYETGSLRAGTLKSHRRRFGTLKAALVVAGNISRRRGGYVTVDKGGLEVAVCHRGKCVKR